MVTDTNKRNGKQKPTQNDRKRIGLQRTWESIQLDCLLSYESFAIIVDSIILLFNLVEISSKMYNCKRYIFYKYSSGRFDVFSMIGTLFLEWNGHFNSSCAFALVIINHKEMCCREESLEFFFVWSVWIMVVRTQSTKQTNK